MLLICKYLHLLIYKHTYGFYVYIYLLTLIIYTSLLTVFTYLYMFTFMLIIYAPLMNVLTYFDVFTFMLIIYAPLMDVFTYCYITFTYLH